MDTAEHILDIVQYLIQSRGYNAFSYQDIADKIGIKKASIHYHFPTKGDLGEAVVKRYRQQLLLLLQELDKNTCLGFTEKFDLYLQPFLTVANHEHLICLCGALGGEYLTLPDKVQIQVKAFFEEHENWLSQFLSQGKKAQAFKFQYAPDKLAKMIFSCLEGALLVVRATGDTQDYYQIVETIQQIIHAKEYKEIESDKK